MNITPIPDRANEPQAEPCATHEVRVQLLVTATVCEGTEAWHVLEYISAHLGNREPDLHEDIFDELEGAKMVAVGREIKEPTALKCSVACMAWFRDQNACASCEEQKVRDAS